MNDITNLSLSRRQFLGMAAAGAGGFVLGCSLPVTPRAGAEDTDGVINAFLAIAEDGAITFQNPFVEMGQGTYTSIPAIIAEELDVEMSAIRVVQAPHGPEYKIMFKNTQRFTGGSLSVRSSYAVMRKTGATARAMLIKAAAQKWGVPVSECLTEPGVVTHKESGKRLGYGKLAPWAAKLQPPADVKLKDRSDFRLIGKPVKRTDSRAKVTGQAKFGVDVRLDDMVYAAVRECPVFEGTVKSFDRSAIENEPGIIAVEEIPNGVAVVADYFWHAKSALDKLPVEFDRGKNADFSDQAYLKQLKSRLDDTGVAAEDEGNVPAAFKVAAKAIESEYSAPFLAHATMEPMNCTAQVTKDHCLVWAPNQGVDFVAQVASKLTGFPVESIEVKTPFLGGGFGRRFMTDYVVQAVTLAIKLKGRPVNVIWTREEDTQHDFYRPMTAAKYRAAFDDKGNPTALHVTTVGDGPMRRHFPALMKNPEIDDSVLEGAIHQPYDIQNRRVNFVYEPVPVPIGFWRSVGNSHNAFFKESFIDEMAHAAKADPAKFRLSLLANQPRFRKVLDTVIKMAGWKRNSWRAANGAQHAMGLALHRSYNSLVAEIAEVSLEDENIRVNKVWCSVDCGMAVNPAIVTMQMESGIAYGLSAALGEQITIEEGRVMQGNFDTYPILTMNDMPEVEVHIINSGEPLGGIGEPGTPPIAPAVCNAIFALTGQRVRSLPLNKLGLGDSA